MKIVSIAILVTLHHGRQRKCITKEVGVRKEVTHILWQVVIDICLTVSNGSVQFGLLSRC